MATKRQKKDRAKALLPTIPLPIRRLTPAGRLYQASKLLAEGLIDLDPLNIISDDPLEQVVNDPEIKLTPGMVDIINDDSLVMMNGEVTRIDEVPVRTESIPRSRQFSRANIVGGINLEGSKRTRKKTKTDKNMSKALRMANARFRKKNGSLRKGATQGKIMKYAHKLLKKM